MADRLAHVCLNVPDADEAVEWYTENFPFEDAWTWTGETERARLYNRYVEDEDGFMLQFREVEGKTDFEEGSAWDHFGVEVDDVDEAFERVDHHGVVMEPQDNEDSDSRIAFIEDLNGYVIEMLAPLEG